MVLRTLCFSFLLAICAVVLSCNEHIFQAVNPITTRTVVNPKKIDIDRAADILFVIDNSGSMKEEQENLARNASSSCTLCTAQHCNAGGFAALKTWLVGHKEVPLEQWSEHTVAGKTARQIYDDCGFIERLQLFENKFHIGVVSTDMGDCDNPSGSGALRSSVPQRGCLQTSSQDPNLTVLKWDTGQLADKFYNIVINVLTYGSAYEKGLQSAEHFLTPGHSVAASSMCTLQRDCSGDLDNFLRQTELNAAGDEVDTKLVIIFLTDEEDCSHDGSIEENNNTEMCYSNPELLVGTDHYVSFFRSLKAHPELVSMALIAGLYDTGSGMRPSGCRECRTQDDVTNFGCVIGEPIATCDEAHGNSIATCSNCTPSGEPLCACHPHIPISADCTQEHAATNCCQADSAKRYYQVATRMESFKVDTLCSNSYKDTMIAIADLVNETGIVVLSETPGDPTQVVVQIKGARFEGWQNVPYCGTETECGSNDGGWSLIDENTRIKFFGNWVPEPGDEVQVMFLGS